MIFFESDDKENFIVQQNYLAGYVGSSLGYNISSMVIDSTSITLCFSYENIILSIYAA